MYAKLRNIRLKHVDMRAVNGVRTDAPRKIQGPLILPKDPKNYFYHD